MSWYTACMTDLKIGIHIIYEMRAKAYSGIKSGGVEHCHAQTTYRLGRIPLWEFPAVCLATGQCAFS